MRHLEENGMTYMQHFAFAAKFSTICIVAGMKLGVHAIVPCAFKKAGSDLLNTLEASFSK